MTRPHLLVTAVGAPPGKNALDALIACQRFRLTAGDADAFAPALYAYRDVGRALLPFASDGPAYLEALKAIGDVDGIVPCIEEEVTFVARHEAALRKIGIASLVPTQRALDRAVHKGHCMALAASLGLPHPATLVVDGGRFTDLSDVATRVAPPWIIKPAIGHGMRGVYRADSVEDAQAHLRTATGEQLVQEFIPGEVGGMHLVALLYDAAGRQVRSFSSRSVRTLFDGGGPATGGVSTKRRDLIDQTTTLLEAVGTWRGPAAVEWMLDPRDDTFKLIEVNPRLWGYASLAVAAGAPFHEVYGRLIFGEDVGPDPGYREGVLMLRTTQDLVFEEVPPGLTLP